MDKIFTEHQQSIAKKNESESRLKKRYASRISHGMDSNRIYLMDLDPSDFPQILPALEQIAEECKYTKIFTKVPARYRPAFQIRGYVIEASVPGFYKGEEDALFLVKYTNPERSRPELEQLEAFQALLLQGSEYRHREMDAAYRLRPLDRADAKAMVRVFKEVFATYPFPIYDTAFLIHSMQEDGTRYYGAFKDGELIAISSAECNEEKLNAEMSDFAVLPAHRGQGLAIHLLRLMEEQLKADGYLTFYTIARLHSLPMNKTFYKLGYRYAGTLTRNTQIAGQIESMNVWYKNARS